MEREWKVISWAHNYEVSNYGEIRRTDNGVYLKPSCGARKTYKVSIVDDNGKPCLGISFPRLVAELFVPNVDNLPVVGHKDNDSSNNRVDNLEWTTWSKANKHRHISEKSFAHSKHAIQVKCVETGEIFESMNECAHRLGISVTSVHNLVNGKNRTRKGFHLVRVD